MMVRNNLGCILADEMGLGKTIQVIAVLMKERMLNKPDLIICPATLITNWIREFKKFTTGIKILPHRGYERTGFPSILEGVDIVITSYDTALRDIQLLKMVDWKTIILDEAQAIKNPEALRSISIKQLSRDSVIAMTGTPLENRLLDLWSICDMAIPGLLGTRSDFDILFGDDRASALRFEALVSPVMLRRTVDEVAEDLPEKIDIPQVLTMSPSSSDLYEVVRKESRDNYDHGGGLASLVYLRMFCCHPLLVDAGHASRILESSEKYQRFNEILEEIFENNQKALIFTSFTRMIDLMIHDIKQRYNVFCQRIDGRVSVSERLNIVDEFSSYSGPAVLVLNPRAGGTGLNITAANHVIHYNPEWNPAIEDQATARAHRLGQERPVMVHRLYFENTIEEVIEERLTRKRQLANYAVVGVDGSDDNKMDILKALRISPKIF